MATAPRRGRPWKKVNTGALLDLLAKQQYLCALTGAKLTPENVSLDHIVPLSKGGQHTIANVQLVTRDANRCKGGLDMREFLAICRRVLAWRKPRRKK